ncbi:hypothetical protein [Roseibium sp. Sym1]|uniref:hypothetical protein n=1 Tax=Roseibium sp. Sym1 TaxID=3016006 RepID=UPI0022B4FC7D|nr:hypothetical protein [Roseibium sp. Sym1]
MINKIIFTSDIYKIDDRSSDHFRSPQSINIDWLHVLFSGFLESLLGVQSEKFSGEEINSRINRLFFFETLGRPVSSQAWASFYESTLEPEFQSRLADYFKDSFVVGFELPPYLINLFNQENVTFVDLSIHPVRYLNDYVFGIRSNEQGLQQRAMKARVPDDVFFDFARLCAARSARVFRNDRPSAGSALFLGQIEVDASLICNGGVYGLEELEASLIDLRRSYSKVYYKFHPHRKDRTSVEDVISKIGGCELIDANVYDLLSCRELSLVTGFSSSAIHEARYFGRSAERILPTRDLFDLRGEQQDPVAYAPAPRDILQFEYWEYLVSGKADFSQTLPTIADDALKYSLNQKWGR